MLLSISIFLSAFLLFQVQPIASKFLLPSYGGTPAVWNACLLFFQTALLLGYGVSHLLARGVGARRLPLVYAALLFASALTLPILNLDPTLGADPRAPIRSLVVLLGTGVGVPYLLLSCSSPLLQTIASRRGHLRPYTLFAVSNIGSLAGLLSYPLFFEPRFALGAQARGWSGGYLVLLVLVGLYLFGRRESEAQANAPLPAPGRTEGSATFSTAALWWAFPFCSSVLLISVTNRVCRDVAPIPMLWIVPLVLYLLSYAAPFASERLYRRRLTVTLFFVLWAMAQLVAINLIPGGASLSRQVPLEMLALALGCLVCHGELALLKPPAERLTSFYFISAFGGACGAAFVVIAAPLVFAHYVEYFLVPVWLAFLLFGGKVLSDFDLRSGRAQLIFVGALFLSVALSAAALSGSEARVARNFFGIIEIKDDPGGALPVRSLMHGAVNHGMQVRAAEWQNVPVGYFGVGSGAEAAIRSRQQWGPVRIGIVGLGAGVLAAYGRAGDAITFFEINPAVVDFASEHFTYLKDSPAAVRCEVGDGRLLLRRARVASFDVIVIDAFSGDSIPLHLLTAEAFGEYLRVLAPGGMLALHISNSYLDLTPVVAKLALSAELDGKVIRTRADPAHFGFPSVWAVLGRRSASDVADLPGTDLQSFVRSEIPLWTDAYSSPFSVLSF